MKSIGGVPWKMTCESAGDGEGMKTEVAIMDKDYLEKARAEGHEVIPRKVYISKADLEIHGYTVGCPGCKSMLRGTARQGHNEACRKRVEKELEGSDKAQRAKKRAGEYVDKKVKEEEDKRRRGSGGDTNSKAAEEAEKIKAAGQQEAGDEEMGKEEERRDEEGDRPKPGAKRAADREVTEEYTAKLMRKLDRRERREKRKLGEREDMEDEMVAQLGEGKNEEGHTVNGYSVNEEVLEIEVEEDEAAWDDEELGPKMVK